MIGVVFNKALVLPLRGWDAYAPHNFALFLKPYGDYMKQFNIDNRHSIDDLQVFIQSEGSTLTVKELKHYLSLTNSSKCSPYLEKVVRQLATIRSEIRQHIKDSTPWYRTNAFYIAMSCTFVAAMVTTILQLTSKPVG